jgi:hypothetical protein
MPLQSRPGPWSVLVSALAAGLMLTVASCSGQVAPLSPAASRPSRLRSPFVLTAMRVQDPTAAGGCPAGSVALAGGSGPCYRRIGTPVTITSATISPVFSVRQHAPAGLTAAPPRDVFTITLPAAGKASLTAVTATAAHAQGYLAISVAGTTWLLPRVWKPFPGPAFQISLPSRNQVLQLQNALVTAPST